MSLVDDYITQVPRASDRWVDGSELDHRRDEWQS